MSPLLCGRLLRFPSVACVCFASLVIGVQAADRSILIDSPGPEYREQSWRLQQSPGPGYLRLILDLHPASPKASYDGEAPRSHTLPLRENFEIRSSNQGWNFIVHDYGKPLKPGAYLERSLPFDPELAPMLLERDSPEVSLRPAVGGLTGAEGPADSEVRLPEIPQVLLAPLPEMNHLELGEMDFTQLMRLDMGQK